MHQHHWIINKEGVVLILFHEIQDKIAEYIRSILALKNGQLRSIFNYQWIGITFSCFVLVGWKEYWQSD